MRNSLFHDLYHRNASAMATGHYLGDTGDFSKHDLYRLSGRGRGGRAVTPFLGRSDPVSAMSMSISAATT